MGGSAFKPALKLPSGSGADMKVYLRIAGSDYQWPFSNSIHELGRAETANKIAFLEAFTRIKSID